MTQHTRRSGTSSPTPAAERDPRFLSFRLPARSPFDRVELSPCDWREATAAKPFLAPPPTTTFRQLAQGLGRSSPPPALDACTPPATVGDETPTNMCARTLRTFSLLVTSLAELPFAADVATKPAGPARPLHHYAPSASISPTYGTHVISARKTISKSLTVVGFSL